MTSKVSRSGGVGAFVFGAPIWKDTLYVLVVEPSSDVTITLASSGIEDACATTIEAEASVVVAIVIWGT